MFFQDFFLGQTFELPPVEITREKIFSFAKDYDPIPLHLDEEYAKSTRFHGLIAPGVLSFMSVWVEFIKLKLWDDSLVAGKSTAVQWLAPVYPGDFLTGKGRITGLTQNNPYNGTVELCLEIFNQNQIKVIHNMTETVIRV